MWCRIWHPNHIKEISGACCMTTPFYVTGVWLLKCFSTDRKGGARPHPKQHHPVPQGPPFSNKYWLATGSSQAIPLKPHSFLKAKAHTTPSRPFCHTTHTRTHLISCVGGATPPSLPPYSPHRYKLPPESHSKLTPTNRLGTVAR
jgi:hypothetical protein